MKFSRNWLQKFFESPLPEAEALAEALTFHSSEVEEVEGDMLDVKVLPDRAGYALSHRGIAYELSAALGVPMKDDPLEAEMPAFPETDELSVTICDEELVPRYMAALVRGVKVGPSPEWLRSAIESVGQRSINNVVDATNYVMLNIGQPLHAFDAGKLDRKDGTYAIDVRPSYEGEKLTTLTGEEYALPEKTLLIAGGASDRGLGIAGIKGGIHAAVNESTVDLLIESASFDGTRVRRAAQALKLFTEASLRFQNRPSPEFAAFGMRDVLTLIREVAGGEVIGVVDRYPAPNDQSALSFEVTRDRLNGVLGTDFEMDEITGALARLRLDPEAEGGSLRVRLPWYRSDLTTPEDLAEEVGRILGYDRVLPVPLPPIAEAIDQRRHRGIERIKDALLERGYVELSTPSFAESGEVRLANPLQMDRPYLRASLAGNMHDALTRAQREAPRTLGPDRGIYLFEIGTVFGSESEEVSLAIGYTDQSGKGTARAAILEQEVAAIEGLVPNLVPRHADNGVVEWHLPPDTLSGIGEGYEPKKVTLGPYRPYSLYPFALRDIAVWTPEGTEETEVSLVIQKEAGELLIRMDLFDTFTKLDRTSYAFRLVFEGADRTLSDADLDPLMAAITASLNSRMGWEAR